MFCEEIRVYTDVALCHAGEHFSCDFAADGFAVQEVRQLFAYECTDALETVSRKTRKVGSYDNIVEREQRVVFCRRFGVEHVDAGILQTAVFHVFVKSRFVNDCTACGVDEHGVLFHELQRVGIYHMISGRNAGRVNGDNVRFFEQCFKLNLLGTESLCGFCGDERVVEQDIDIEVPEQLDIMLACPAAADYADLYVKQLGDVFLALLPTAVFDGGVQRIEVFGRGKSEAERGFRNAFAERAGGRQNADTLVPQCVAVNGLDTACRVCDKFQVGTMRQNLFINSFDTP